MEEFRDIPGWEGFYMVSNLGRVKSLDRQVWNGRSWYKLKGRILKPTLGTEGYFFVSLVKNKFRKVMRIHQLVAMAFLNHVPCGYKLVVNHRDSNRLNNMLDNLEVVTQRENSNYKKGVYSSKYPGVHWSNSRKKWVSSIKVRGKSVRLGSFDCEELAREYYENAVIALREGKDIVVKRADYSSKYVGVSWHKATNKWIARITISSGTSKYLGVFKTELEAHQAHQKALREIVPTTPSLSI